MSNKIMTKMRIPSKELERFPFYKKFWDMEKGGPSAWVYTLLANGVTEYSRMPRLLLLWELMKGTIGADTSFLITSLQNYVE